MQYISMINMLKNRYLWLSLLWFAASLYFLFFKTPGNEPPPFPHFDKVAHCGLFFVQTWFVGKTWLAAGYRVPWRAVAAVLLVWAGLSEVFQAAFTSDREGDVWDALADACGIFSSFYFLKHSNNGQKLS